MAPLGFSVKDVRTSVEWRLGLRPDGTGAGMSANDRPCLPVRTMGSQCKGPKDSSKGEWEVEGCVKVQVGI